MEILRAQLHDYYPFTTVKIGSQEWMARNYDFKIGTFPNSSEDNNNVYGGLFTWDQAVVIAAQYPGWHLPTVEDFEILSTYLGGDTVSGGHLKVAGTDYWNAPNLGADNLSGFGAVGAGIDEVGFKESSSFWSSTEGVMVDAYYIAVDKDLASLTTGFTLAKTERASVRLIKDYDYVLDYDGNAYTYVTIGTQQWMVQNLRTEHYADGTAIPNLTLGADWLAEDGTAGHDGAFCYYDNNETTYKRDYGALYNWYALDNAHGLAPTGWRVPSDDDLNTLVTYLGGQIVAGGVLKEAGYVHWNSPNTGATNGCGFSSVGGGYRNPSGSYANIKIQAAFWSSDDDPAIPEQAGITTIGYDSAIIQILGLIEITFSKSYGCTIRCMRDIP